MVGINFQRQGELKIDNLQEKKPIYEDNET